MLINIILATFFASALSLILVSLLLLHKKLIHSISFYLVAFAAGALLATGFLDVLREAVNQISDTAFYWTTFSIAGFFVIERLFVFFHHHDEEKDDDQSLKLPTGALIFGDALHNLIDGASIAASFLASFHLGIVTTVAVFIHEIPHELGDFGILIHKGWGRMAVLSINALTGLAAILGALATFYIGNQFKEIVPVLLSITAGNFIYLSATDLLPEIHHKARKSLAFEYISFFVLGVMLIAFLVKFLD